MRQRFIISTLYKSSKSDTVSLFQQSIYINKQLLFISLLKHQSQSQQLINQNRKETKEKCTHSIMLPHHKHLKPTPIYQLLSRSSSCKRKIKFLILSQQPKPTFSFFQSLPSHHFSIIWPTSLKRPLSSPEPNKLKIESQYRWLQRIQLHS